MINIIEYILEILSLGALILDRRIAFHNERPDLELLVGNERNDLTHFSNSVSPPQVPDSCALIQQLSVPSLHSRFD